MTTLSSHSGQTFEGGRLATQQRSGERLEGIEPNDRREETPTDRAVGAAGTGLRATATGRESRRARRVGFAAEPHRTALCIVES